jgi:hypothetical protein
MRRKGEGGKGSLKSCCKAQADSMAQRGPVWTSMEQRGIPRRSVAQHGGRQAAQHGAAPAAVRSSVTSSCSAAKGRPSSRFLAS